MRDRKVQSSEYADFLNFSTKVLVTVLLSYMATLYTGHNKAYNLKWQAAHKVFSHYHFHENIEILTKNIYRNALTLFYQIM